MTQPRFSIVIPIHNEASFLRPAAARLAGELKGLEAGWEVILVENGSTDGTLAVAESISEELSGFRLTSLPDPDYGAAMRAGFLAGEGEWLVNFDIDYFSADFLRDVLRQEQADIVLASKLAPGSSDLRPPLRRLGTRAFNLLLRLLFRSGVSDTHGMKAIRREVVGELIYEVEATRDLFDTELIIRAERAGRRIIEVPAMVEEARSARSSFLRRVPRTLLGLIRLWRRLGAA